MHLTKPYLEANWYAAKNTVGIYTEQFFSFISQRYHYFFTWIQPSIQKPGSLPISIPACPSRLSVEEKMKFMLIVQKIEDFKNRFSISTPLQIRYEENISSPAISPSTIFFGKELIQMPVPIIDFVLAHEFSHVNLRHLESKERFHRVLSVVEFISLFVFFPLVVPVAVISFFIAGKMWRQAELQADAKALSIVGTSEGAKQFFSHLMQREKKYILEEINISNLSEKDQEFIFNTALNFWGYSHPNLVERQNQVEKIKL